MGNTSNSPKSRFYGSAILFRGGLSDQLSPRREVSASLRKISLELQKALRKNLSALDLAEYGARLLEDDPHFNAGFGAKLQSDGQTRLSAALMDGESQRMASVSNILSIKNPSKVCRLLLKGKDRNLSGIEATRFAYQNGIRPQSVITEQRHQEWLKKMESSSGTIGCVALDFKKRLAACTSTGGRGFEMPGRTSDSSTPAGNFANSSLAISCTGIGENILDAGFSSQIAARREDGLSLNEAAEKSLFRHQQKRFGFIAIDVDGSAMVHATEGSLAFGIITKTKIKTGFFPWNWT